MQEHMIMLESRERQIVDSIGVGSHGPFPTRQTVCMRVERRL